MPTRQQPRRYRRHQLRIRTEPGTRTWRIYSTALLLLVLGTALTFVWFRSDEVKRRRTVQHLRREYAARTKELENLRMKVETYRSGKHILNAVERLQLGLRPPLPGQVRRIPVGPAIPGQTWESRPLVATR